MLKFKGLPCVGLQLDLWTDRNSSLVYAALHSSIVTEPQTLFKQVSAHLAHEGNAEETFSLAGRLSHDNTHTQPGFLSALVRTNKNRSAYDPPVKAILGQYKSEYRKLPDLGDDVTDNEDLF